LRISMSSVPGSSSVDLAITSASLLVRLGKSGATLLVCQGEASGGFLDVTHSSAPSATAIANAAYVNP
jgi:hypothetical protein